MSEPTADHAALKPQRQDSLLDQLRTVHGLATEAECYDAADAIKRTWFGEPIPSRNQLIALAKMSPPPQSWFDEPSEDMP